MASSTSSTDDLLPTRDSLLSRLRDLGDGPSWSDFFARYWRLIYQVARQSGLTHHESQEVVQETVITVSRHIPEFRYDPRVCSFKTWLMNLTRWRIVDQVRKRQRGRAHESQDAADQTRTDKLQSLPDPADEVMNRVWDLEWKNHLFQLAVQRIKVKVSPEQYQVFDLYVVQDWPVMRVAKELGVSVASVYLAKHRISRLIRQEIRVLEKGPC